MAIKLKEYIANLNKLVKEHPEALTMDVVYSIDDEGNGFKKINYAPQLGEYQGDNHPGDFDGEGENKNSVCIN
jgi:hypothetical protein